MAHTRFFDSETKAQSEFDAMKEVLSGILAGIPLPSELEAETKSKLTSPIIAEFVERFP
jgi:hypothetical protein